MSHEPWMRVMDASPGHDPAKLGADQGQRVNHLCQHDSRNKAHDRLHREPGGRPAVRAYDPAGRDFHRTSRPTMIAS